MTRTAVRREAPSLAANAGPGRWSAGPSAVAGGYLGGGGVGGPRPGRREYVHVGFSATSVGVLRRSGGERKGPRVAPRPFRNGVWPDDQARPACFITSAA